MLPGFRFLFAAIVLSMSMMVFGLGAAALLRAAHEEFASNPSLHTTPRGGVCAASEATSPCWRCCGSSRRPRIRRHRTMLPAVAAVAPRASSDRSARSRARTDCRAEAGANVTAGRPQSPTSRSRKVRHKARRHPAQTDAPAAAEATKSATSAAADDAKIASSTAQAPPSRSRRRRTKQPRPHPNRRHPNKRAHRPSRRPTLPRRKSPRWAAHPSPETRRRRKPPAQSPTGAPSRNAAGAAGGPSAQDAPHARASGGAGRRCSSGRPIRSLNHIRPAAGGSATTEFAVRRGRLRPAVRRAGPIRPMSRHKARCRARRADKARASTPARTRRSRRSSRSVSSYRRRRR